MPYDTSMQSSLEQFQAVVVDLGFELVLEVPFQYTFMKVPPTNEKQFFYAHRDGMLLIVDTFVDGTVVNSANMFHAHRPNNKQRGIYPYSSGSYESAAPWPAEGAPEDLWWFGDNDVRQGLRHTIDNLREHGQFLSPWPRSYKGNYWMWCCHCGDLSDLDHRDPRYQEQINAARRRLLQLPDWVKEMIQPALPT